ncbi:MAG TPA: serine hydrolase [Streptosporangiaceae bacterium]|nr:serine hydrolase [Streptosporangiaceae bacterium]
MSAPEPALMVGAPPFAGDAQVTLANWQDPPFNRWAFQHVRELIPSARIAGTSHARPLPSDEHDLGRLAFLMNGAELTVDEFLDGSYTDGFLVVHKGHVVTERYLNGMRPETPHLLMSVSKSVTATVAGVLAGRGVLDPAAEIIGIVPELAGTSFPGATVQHLLDMRAGTRFNEDYADLDADVRSYERIYLWRPPAGGQDAADAISYFATLTNDGPHGGPFRYRSILTDVLAWVIERAAGQRLHELISRELWQPMGAEYDAEITLDRRGNAMADGGVSATLRDLARFGLLYLNRGLAGDRQVVPGWWVDDTVRGAPDGPRAFAEGDDRAGYPEGGHYRNCWWVREPALPFYHGSGINGQGVFVHGPSQTVVAKLSTWPVAWSDELYGQTIACVRAITGALAAGDV